MVLGLVPPLFLWGLLRIRRVVLPLSLPWALGGLQEIGEPLDHDLVVVVVGSVHADVPSATVLVWAGRKIPVVPQVVLHNARHFIRPQGAAAVFEAPEGVPVLVRSRSRSCRGVKYGTGARRGAPHGTDSCLGSQGV